MPGLLSEDGEVAYTYFTFNFGKDGWNKIEEPVEEIKDLTAIDGVDVYVGGYGGQAYDFISSFDGSHITLLLMTFGVVILILLFTYRSPVLWILPIISAVVANTMAGGVVYLLAKYAGLVVNDQSQYILSILVIGAGTDYALLLTARYREELRRHEDRHEAMAFALHRAAPAIIASAATVVIGLMCLSFADLNSTASLGPVLAVGVAVTLLVMVTLLPALLVIFGRWIFWPERPTLRLAEPTQTGIWARVGDRIKVRPRAGVGRDRGACCRGLPRPVPARRQRPVHRGLLHRDPRLGHGAEAARRPRPGRQLQHDPGGHQQRPAGGGRGCLADIDGLGTPPTPSTSMPVAASSRSPSSSTSPPRRRSTSSTTARDDVHAVEARMPSSAAGRRLPRHQDRLQRDNKVVIPLVLLVIGFTWSFCSAR